MDYGLKHFFRIIYYSVDSSIENLYLCNGLSPTIKKGVSPLISNPSMNCLDLWRMLRVNDLHIDI